MKKLFLFLAAVASVSMMSCTKNSDFETLGDEAIMSFSIEIESQIDKRAISDGNSVDCLMYAIFNGEGTELVVSKVTEENMTDLINGGSFSVSLPKGHTYKAVFWAQNSDCTAYTVSDDMKVTVNYDGYNNDESRDAFFGSTKAFKLSKDSFMEVVLKRPFAQVNVGTYPSEMEYVKELGIDIKESSATISGVADCINLLDGSVEGCTDVTFKASVLPAEKLYVDVDNNDVKEVYEYLSMCYVLADRDRTSHSMSFEFVDENGEGVGIPEISSVPLIRNWRSNILGWLFTKKGEINIQIDSEYENDYTIITSSEGVYYNITEDTTFENSTYILGDYNEGCWFASENGQLVTLNNVDFYGSVWTVSFGEYRGPKYANYNNVLNNVTCTDLVVSNTIKDHDVFVSVGTCMYGNSVLNNCRMTGTTTVATVHFDGTPHDYTPVDLGVPNECDAVINGGEYGSMYLWTHAVLTINNAKVGRIICSCCNSTKHSNLTVAAGTTVDVIDCTQPARYGSRLIIEKGATVGELNLVNASFSDMVIEGTVNRITYNGVEYTLDELKALGL